jgi:hypothetical protein
MQLKLFLGLIILYSFNCNSQPNEINEETVYESKNSSLKKVLDSFKDLSSEIENVYKNDTTRIELYLKIDEKGFIKRVPNFDDVPDAFYSSYNVIKNKTGKIIYIAEYPQSESGDWFTQYENYFDDSGNLVSFIRKSSFFNGECAEVVCEESEYYYDSNHILVKKTYEITDDEGNPLDYTKCTFYYRNDYIIYQTLEEYLKHYKFDK